VKSNFIAFAPEVGCAIQLSPKQEFVSFMVNVFQNNLKITDAG